MKKSFRNNQTLLLILFAGLMLRLYLIYIRPVAPDELWTFYYVDNNIATIIKGSFADFRPPLYYLLLYVWKSVFAATIVSYRLFSLLISIPGLIFIYKAARTVFTKKLALFTVYLASTSAGLMYDAADGRMFALGFTISCFALWQALAFFKYKKQKSIILLFLSFIIASYTYLYLLFLIPGIFIYIIDSKILPIKKLLIYFLVFLLFLIPFFYFFITSIAYLSSFHEQLSSNPLKILTVLIIPILPSEFIFALVLNNLDKILIILSGVIFLIIGQFYRKGFSLSNSIIKKIAISYLFLPLAFLLLLSLLIKPLIGIHSLIFFTPIIYLLITKACEKSFLNKLIITVIVILVTFYYFANINLLQTDLRAFYFLKANHKTNDLIVQQDIYPFIWTRYLLDNPQQTSLEKSEFNPLIEKVFKYSYLNPEQLNMNRVFLITINKNPYVPIYELFVRPNKINEISTSLSEKILKEKGYQEIKREAFDGITIIIFSEQK